MRIFGLIFIFVLGHGSLAAQYFFTGEVKDPHGDKIQNGLITIHSTGLSYQPGFNGEFGIRSAKQEDTLTLSFEGYEPYTTAISATGFLQVILKKTPSPTGSGRNYFKSVYRSAQPGGNKEYTSPAENMFADQRTSVSFAGGMTHGSYPLVQRFLDMGSTVPREAVKIEEMVNYFNFYYEDPEKEDLFRCSSDLLPCPWNKLHSLLYLHVCARKANRESSPPANLVFLIDASGSMDMPDKLPLVKSGLSSLIRNLRDSDIVSVVEFGARTSVLLQGIPGSQRQLIIKTIEGLEADGPTPGEAGVRLAYEVARQQFIAGGNNRVLLVTDGDISDGSSNRRQLEDFIGRQNEDSIHLDCMEVGPGNFKNSELSVLARIGQGTFGAANDEGDLENLLLSQLTQTSVTVADGVTITADFNPALVREYRLIGFDNKTDNRINVPENPASGLEGSRICSGHSLLALFELVPATAGISASPASPASPAVAGLPADAIATIRINYWLPGRPGAAPVSVSYNCPNTLAPFDKAAGNLKKAACIAIFGMKLRESRCVSEISWTDIEKMAKQAFTGHDPGDRSCIESITKARKIYR